MNQNINGNFSNLNQSNNQSINLNNDLNAVQNLNYSNIGVSNQKSNKKKFFIIGSTSLIVVILVILLAVLIGGKNSRTVMIYMVGSNLETNGGLATVDLESINYKEMDNENVNVVLIAGGAEDWKNNYIDESDTAIYELTSEGYKKVKSQSLQNMGSNKTFTSYLNYVYDNYKTKEYDLVFWNHGGAIDGSEYDDLSNDNLSLEEMRLGLANSKFNKNNKLEVVIFRTCLNGTIEVAEVFSDYAKYLVASEEITLGASYTSVLNFVNDIEVDDAGNDVGLRFIESYKNQIKDLKTATRNSEYIYSTYSLIDLSKIDKLVDSLNEFVDGINVIDDYNEIARIRSNLYQYAYEQAGDKEYDMVDLYNLVTKLQPYSEGSADNVLRNFEDAVLYNWATNDQSRGLSIYFPYNGNNLVKTSLLSVYNEIDDMHSYNKFISKFYNIQKGGTKQYSFSDNKTNVTSNIEDKADFTLELTQEQLEGFAKAEYLVFLDKGEGYYWPVYLGKEATLNGNTLNASINGRHLKIKEDGDEYVIPLYESYNSEKYIKYLSFAILEDFSSDDISEWKMDNVNLSIIYDKENNKIDIDSVVLNTDSDTVDNIQVNLDDYQYIAFGSMSHKLIDENGNVDMDLYALENNGIYEGVEVEISKLNFELAELGSNSNYYCVFRIYDVNNNVYYSNLIKMN